MFQSINKMKRSFGFRILALVGLLGMISCEDELQLPDNVIGFESSELGISSDEAEITVNINFSREATEPGTLLVTLTPNGVTYGTEFTTDPAAENNTINLAVEKGASLVSFRLIKVADALFDGDEQIEFTLESSVPSLILGEKNTFKLTFAEIISEGARMDPNVGGNDQPNKVFVDLSANRQTSLSRSAWDLGFFTAEGEFKVVLNSSSAMLARALDKTDLNAVSAADTTGWGVQFSTDAIFAAVLGPPPAWINQAVNWIDAPSGDMNATAIASISATEADNKVYIVNRGENPDGSQRGWKKIRILRNGTGYTLQHADINATSFQTIEVTRDNAYLFNYINFDAGLVSVEPKKSQWDIAFTVFTNTTAIGGPGSALIPYVFLDVVVQNRFEVQTVEVLNTTVAYENFGEANLGGLAFGTSQINIGSKWRTGGGPTSSPALRTDRFYVIKDAAGNIYKLKFTALTQNGERGRPQFEFALVAKGS